ncbi:MAG: YdcF family protein [Acidimicrobiia bacterium]|nr:YdcF family protein [Acidimicrobiia bacterium]
MRRILVLVAGVLCAIAAAAIVRVTLQVHAQARLDEARPADVIIVLGAAEYSGRPSPVLKARLDHALELYRRKLAPRILTTGGAGGDPIFTEGDVGRAYLLKRDVPAEAVIVEREGETTAQSASAAVEIMQRMGLRSCLVVTDGYHLFRVKKIFEQKGLQVYGSPRPSETIQGWRLWRLCGRQAVAYLMWRVGIVV